jgi:hypothetical protein
LFFWHRRITAGIAVLLFHALKIKPNRQPSCVVLVGAILPNLIGKPLEKRRGGSFFLAAFCRTYSLLPEAAYAIYSELIGIAILILFAFQRRLQ